MFPEADDYYDRMAARKRVIYGDLGDGRKLLCTFFVLQEEAELKTFYDRPCWSTPPDHHEGTIIYIDKLIASLFNKAVWTQIERALAETIPGWETAIWYRPGQDIDRRYNYVRKYHGDHIPCESA